MTVNKKDWKKPELTMIYINHSTNGPLKTGCQVDGFGSFSGPSNCS